MFHSLLSIHRVNQGVILEGLVLKSGEEDSSEVGDMKG